MLKTQRVRAVVQRVAEARVVVDGGVVGEIGRGLCVLLGVGRTDTETDAEALCRKVKRVGSTTCRVVVGQRSVTRRSSLAASNKRTISSSVHT